MTMKGAGHRPVWARRWLLIRLSLIWCALVATWTIIWGPDDALRQASIYGIFGLAGSIILGYCGFATWDDRNFMSYLSRTSRHINADSSSEQGDLGQPPEGG